MGGGALVTESPAMADVAFRDLIRAVGRAGAASRPQPTYVLARLRELGRPATVQECLRDLFPGRRPLEIAEAFARGISEGDIVEIQGKEDADTIRYVAERRYRHRPPSAASYTRVPREVSSRHPTAD